MGEGKDRVVVGIGLIITVFIAGFEQGKLDWVIADGDNFSNVLGVA